VKAPIVIGTFLLLVLSGAFLLEGCRRSEGIGGTPLPLSVPVNFPQPVYNFTANPTTEEGFRLGRKLFFDGRLSIDGAYACASCHEPRAAFTTFEHDRSHGYNHSHTLRNAPGLFNLAWSKTLRWDGSANSLESIALAHITAPDEMAERMTSVVLKLGSDTAYQRMFRTVYGSSRITTDGVLRALSQYLVHLVSADSKYDRVKRGTAAFTAQEAAGYAVFQSKCSTCHQEPLFTDYSFRNTGLTLEPSLNDKGLMRVTGRREDSLKFRVPSLRNVDLTSYYGHDGRMSVFRMMIQHYRSGVQPGPTVDPLVAGGIPISPAEENSLVAFLRTLSDSAFLNNARYRE
jgi:cytochrome c peroxidase